MPGSEAMNTATCTFVFLVTGSTDESAKELPPLQPL